jgi:phage terminase large subunit-like protein
MPKTIAPIFGLAAERNQGFLLLQEQRRRAAAERAEREQKQAAIENIPSLAEFVQESWHVLEGGSECDWNWHMEAIAFHCQELFFDWMGRKRDENFIQRSRKLLINVPPGSAKSRIVSVCLPAWAWLHYPEWRVICLSSNPRVALRDSLYCRDLIESDWYTNRFKTPWKLRYDQNTKSLFNNTAGGWRKALGWGSRITGDRGDWLLADDPHDAEEANSDVKRQAVIDRWDNAIGNRVNDLRVSCYLGIMQRLKENDWGGHVLKEGWDLLKIPQEYEGDNAKTIFGWADPRQSIGELMFPKRFPAEIIDSEKLRLGDAYSGQHQQRPTAAGGGMFKIRNWRLYNPRSMPPIRRTILSLDCSFKDSSKSDFNALAVIAESMASKTILLPSTYFDKDLGIERHNTIEAHDYYIIDLWHEKGDITATETALQQFTADYPEARIKLIEDAANGPAIISRLKGSIPGITEFDPGRTSKDERAAAIQPIQKRGDIYLPIGEAYIHILEMMGLDSISLGDWWAINPPEHEADATYAPVDGWVKELIDEFTKFPKGANDDIVDAVDQAIIYMEANGHQDAESISPVTVTNDPRERRAVTMNVNDRLRKQRDRRL